MNIDDTIHVLGTANTASGSSVPYLIGTLVPILLLSAGILKCFQIMRRSKTHATCVMSLTAVLIGWCLLIVLNKAKGYGIVANLVAGLLDLVGIAVIFAGFVLGIVGLVDYRRHREQFNQGRKQAWWGIGLAILFCGLAVVAVTTGFSQKVPERMVLKSDPAIPVDTNARGRWLRYEDENYRFRLPGRPWTQLDHTKINPEASLVFLRAQPQVFFMILAEKIGVDNGMSADTLVEIVQANISGIAQDFKINGKRTQTINGVEVTDIRADARLNMRWFNYMVRVISHNGYAYQLQSWALRSVGTGFDRYAREMFDRFEILDRDRVFRSAGAELAKSIRDTGWGFAVDVGDSGWTRWDDLQADAPGALYGALSGAGSAFVVVPIKVRGPSPKKPWFINAMLTYFHVTYPSKNVTDVRRVTRGNAEGYRVTFFRTVDGTDLRYRVDLLRNDRFAYLVGGWTVGDQEVPLDTADQMIQSVTILPHHPSQSSPPDPRPNDALRLHWALVHHQLGMEAYTSRNLDVSLAYFEHAFELQPEDPQKLLNIINLLTEQDQYDRALSFLQENIGDHADNNDVLAYSAWLHHNTGKNDAAIAIYARVFADGFDDEDYYPDYVGVLQEVGRYDDAVAELDRFIVDNPSGQLIRMRASIYKDNEQYDQAASMLNQHLDDGPFDAQTAYDLAATYYAADRYDMGVATCNRLIEEDYNTWEVLNIKGRCELGLSRYTQAKASFEQAATLNPGNEEIAHYVNLLTATLEQGDGQPPDQGGGGGPDDPPNADAEVGPVKQGPPPAPN